MPAVAQFIRRGGHPLQQAFSFGVAHFDEIEEYQGRIEREIALRSSSLLPPNEVTATTYNLPVDD